MAANDYLIVVDSCCDLPSQIAHAEGIELVCLSWIVDGVDHPDDLYQTVSAKEFFDAVRSGAEPSTSQVPIQSFIDVFARCAKENRPVVFFGISSGLSGTVNSANMAKDQVVAEYPDAEIYVVDTLNASVPEGLLVLEAMNQREKGMTAAELAEWAQEALYYVNCEFMVDDLEALARGGRIPSTVAMAGAKLDVKPLLSISTEGKLVISGVARGRKKGIKQLVANYQKNCSNLGYTRTIVMANADCPKDMARLREELEKVDDNVIFFEGNIGTVIGSHVGAGMVALAFWGVDRREAVSVADRIAQKVKGKK